MPRQRTVTKRPTYGDAVRWIADNDATGDNDSVEVVSGYISVVLVADLFGADPWKVAVDVGAGPFAR